MQHSSVGRRIIAVNGLTHCVTLSWIVVSDEEGVVGVGPVQKKQHSEEENHGNESQSLMLFGSILITHI